VEYELEQSIEFCNTFKVPGVQFTPDEAKSLTEKIAEAGTAVVNAKEGAGSATLSMAYAALRFTMALVNAANGQKVMTK
jgi:malate/lactate dehydrogenase